MNKKLTNYVNGLFSDYPNTKKVQELKEEILSNLNEHFEDAVKNGDSENKAYTEAISKLGDIDELLQSIIPNEDESKKINAYKKRKAKITSISVILYILGAAFLMAIPGISAITNKGDIALCGIIGLITLLIFVAIATGLIIYVNMSIPQDVEAYVAKKEDAWVDKSTTKGAIIGMINDILPILILVAYFLNNSNAELSKCSFLKNGTGTLSQVRPCFLNMKQSNVAPFNS